VGVSAANIGLSVAKWGDRDPPEARWRLRGDRFRRDPFVRQSSVAAGRREAVQIGTLKDIQILNALISACA
jgi:hypothetical protein